MTETDRAFYQTQVYLNFRQTLLGTAAAAEYGPFGERTHASLAK